MGSASPKTHHILIIGAGLGGLTLANGLKSSAPDTTFHIYEADPTADFRPQGYRLKINEDGASALKSVLTPEMWTYFEQTCADSKTGETDFNALDGGILASRAGAGFRGRTKEWTADRTILRKLLQTGIDDKHISYGKQLIKYTLKTTTTPGGGDGGVIAHFADGTTAEGTLLVGADGVRSAVRKQFLPDHKPLATNGSCIYGKTPITPELMERFPSRAAKWLSLIVERTPITQFLHEDTTPLTLLLEPVRFQKNELRENMPHDYIYWVLIARTEVFGREAKDMVGLSGAESAGLSLDVTTEWHDGFRALFELQDVKQSACLRVGSAHPEIREWETSERVTLLGDAIHVMSPCGGVGAVTAIMDGAKLAENIVRRGGVSKESIGAYEAAMRKYAGISITRSYLVGKRMFAQRPFDECEALAV